MVTIFPAVFLYALFVFLFCRETQKDYKRSLEQNRLGDEHVLREVERFLKDKSTE